jgi:hypothetical protein
LSGRDLIDFDVESFFVRPIASQYESLQAALRNLKAREPAKKVVLVAEAGFMGTVASILATSGIKPDAHITMA